jgi:hypothetical protein
MTSADEYRGRAHEAQVMELETHDPFMRRTYAKLASHWLELAERFERDDAAADGSASEVPSE